MRWLAPLVVAFAPLALAGPPVENQIARLEKAVTAEHASTRESALTHLSRLRHPRVPKILAARFRLEGSPPLRRLIGHLLSERYPLAYYRELRALVRDGRRKRVASLVDHAIDEPARFLRALDLWAALQLDPASTRRRVKSYLLDPDVNRVLRAAELFGDCAVEQQGKALYPLLRHPRKYVRIEAVLALTKLRTLDCDEELARVAVDDKLEHVRRHAVWALYERGGVDGLREHLRPFARSSNDELATRATQGLDIVRIRSKPEEGPLFFRYQGKISNVLTLFRAAELERKVEIAAEPADARKRIVRALALMDAQVPKYSFFVRYAFKRITFSERHPTGTYVDTRLFNIKAKTVRDWSLDHLAKTLVHDATHAYLHVMGEKSGEHRGESECFQEAFWLERLLTGKPGKYYDREVDSLLKKQHWAGERNY